MIAMRDFVLFTANYIFALASAISCYSKSQLSFSCLRESSFEITRPARTQPAEVIGIFAICVCDISAAFIHTVHGGTEPRACLTALRV